MQNKKTPFVYLASLSGFSLLALDLYQPALPAITAFFNTTHALGQLTMSLYLFFFGLAQLFWGPLLDHYGRKKCLPFGLGLFLTGTLICILASNMNWLILGRIIQGFAICCANVLAYSSTRDYEDALERAKAISHISMVVSVSPIFAPLAGSMVYLYYGWQATFVLMAIIALIQLVLSYIILLEAPNWIRPVKGTFKIRDFFSHYHGFFSSVALLKGTIMVTAAYASAMIFVVNAAFLIMVLLHFSPTVFAVFFACNGMMMIIGNFIGISLRKFYSTGQTMIIGGLINVSGALLMLILHFFNGFTLLTLSPILLVTLGVTLINPPAFSLAVSAFEDNAASATSFINTAKMSGAALIAGLVGTGLVKTTLFLPMSLLICGLTCLLVSHYSRLSRDNE